MLSQIKLTEVKYYELMPKQDFAGLKLINQPKEFHLP